MRVIAAIICLTALLQEATIHLDVSLMQFVVSVTDPNGRFVRNLNAGDLVLQEDGETLPVAFLNTDIETPISVGILLDDSLSMDTGGRSDTAIGMARVLVRTYKPQDEFLLMKFASKMSVVQGYTSDRHTLESLLREMGPSELGTDVVGSVDRALLEVRKASNRNRGLVVVSDVEDNGGKNLRTLRDAIQTRELPVFTFAIRPAAGSMIPGTEKTPVSATLKALDIEDARRSLSIETDKLRAPDTPERIAEFVRDIETDLRGQYVLGYYSKSHGPESDRVIRVHTASPEFQVHIRRETLKSMDVLAPK